MANSVKAKPDGYHTVTPYLPVRGVERLLDFLTQTFDAQVVERHDAPDGSIRHAEVRIGDSVVMITEDSEPGAPARSPTSLGGMVSAVMALYWENVDEAWERAVTAGRGGDLSAC